MKYKRIEYHQVHSHITYDIPDQDIINAWGSLERFREVLSHKNSTSDWDNEPFGEPPTDDENELWYEFFDNYDHDRYDDWFTERKGGFDETYEIVDDEEQSN